MVVLAFSILDRMTLLQLLVLASNLLVLDLDFLLIALDLLVLVFDFLPVVDELAAAAGTETGPRTAQVRVLRYVQTVASGP